MNKKNNDNSEFIVVLLVLGILGCLFVGGIMFIASFLIGVNSDATKADQYRLLYESGIFLLIAIICGISIYLIKRSPKNKYAEPMVAVEVNRNNKCINCGTEFGIDIDVCPKCHSYGDKKIPCPRCGALNNIHRGKCTNCWAILTEEYRKENANILCKDTVLKEKVIKLKQEGKKRCINCGEIFDKEKDICPHCNFTSDVKCICPKCHKSNDLNRIECPNCGQEIQFKDKFIAVDNKIRTYLVILIIVLFVILFIVSFMTNGKINLNTIHYVVGIAAIIILLIIEYLIYNKYKLYSSLKTKLLINERKFGKIS